MTPVGIMTPKRSHTLNFFVLISLLVFFYSVSLPLGNRTKTSLGYPKDSLLNFTELSSQNGYVSEQHTVVTEDGYILTVFRIAKGRNCRGRNRLPPAFLMHGLLESADVWLSAGPSAGLAYLISDACFDLWVGNCRGNYYARKHVSLDPDKDAKFWQFSVDEIGRYDVPAMVDYVLRYTGVDKLNYIGFSQGAGTFFIMCSEMPEYCTKINVMISLAPATRQLNTRSVSYRFLAQAFLHSEGILRKAGVMEVLSKGSAIQEFLAFFCQFYSTESICNIGQALIDSEHPGSVSNETTRVLYGHFPAGTSLHNMARYGQSMTQKDFMKFDYGKEKNLKVYGSVRPPRYNFNATTCPVVVIFGKNDGLVDVSDVKWLVRKLPNVIDVVQVKDPLWNHLDVTYSRYTSDFLFPKIYEHLVHYSFS